MAGATSSGCINHPGVEAVARCKQCGKPVCSTCLVTGPTGNFCGMECRDKHQEFMKRAQSLQRTSRGASGLRSLVSLLIKLIILLVVLGAVCIVAVLVEIPVLTPVVRRVLAFISAAVPF